MTFDLAAILRLAQKTLPDTQQERDEKLLRRAAMQSYLKKLYQYKMEGIRLARSLPHLEPFHACFKKWRTVNGGNRSSKTFSCALETCRAWCSCDPYDKYVPHKGNSLVIAQELDDVARLWRTCETEGQFKIIRDEKDGLWRAVRPDFQNPLILDAYDAAYKEKWKDAPPLLPPRMIEDIAWEDKAKRIPRFVRFTTGWLAQFRSSLGEPQQGDHYHHGWIDEQLSNDLFYSELNRGLVGINEPPHQLPKGIWSATSQSTNLQLFELHEAALKGAGYVESFHTTIYQNPFIPDDEKRLYAESLDEDEKAVRIEGVFAIATRRIYGEYSPMGVHGCEPFDIPENWCRYVILDPGHDRTGTLFIAIDPDEKHVWVYDGFEARQTDAAGWAQRIATRQGTTKFEAFVIDQQAGRQNSFGAGKSVAKQYFEALKEAGVEPNTRGPLDGFYPGSNLLEARTESLLGWLEIRQTGPYAGTPKLKVFRGAVPQLDQQLHRAHTNPKKPNKRQQHKNNAKYLEDVLVCLEYAAAFDPPYREPAKAKIKKRTIFDVFQERRSKKRRRARDSSLNPLS